MIQNRLSLNFNLETQVERARWLQTYLNTPQFKQKPPTQREAEQITNYLLWGKSDSDQTYELQSAWTSTHSKPEGSFTNPLSLDALQESVTFNEATLEPLSRHRTVVPRVVFSRSEARERANSATLSKFESLWRHIDETDALIGFYEFNVGHRNTPPRESLLRHFSPDEVNILKDRAQKLTQYRYLKLRKLLIELRREQYTLKESYANPVVRDLAPEPEFTIDNLEIRALPFPLLNYTTQKFYQPLEVLIPSTFNAADLRFLARLYWKAHDGAKTNDGAFTINFEDPNHIAELILDLDQLAASLEGTRLGKLDNVTEQLIATLSFFTHQANLTNIQRFIVGLKARNFKNSEISKLTNKKYGTTYRDNYISTIFRTQVCVEIAATASHFREHLEALPFEEEFKTCRKCGRTLIKSNTYFVSRASAKDGYCSTCKDCDRAQRQAQRNSIKKLQKEKK